MLAVVADDDPEMRELVSELLRHEGLAVAEACDGMQLMEVLDGGGVSLIVTDHHMPRLEGSEVLQRLRDSGDRTPLLMITGEPDACRAAVDQSALAWLIAKPFTRLGLLRALVGAFDARRR